MQVIHRAGKLGLGTAVVAGFAAATAEVAGRHGRRLQPSAGAGARHAGGHQRDEGRRARRQPVRARRQHARLALARRLLSRAACLLARPLSPIRDAASGFFLIRRSDGARRQHPGRRLQDLPRADRPRLAGPARRDPLSVRRPRIRREQDEPARSGRLPRAVEGPVLAASDASGPPAARVPPVDRRSPAIEQSSSAGRL